MAEDKYESCGTSKNLLKWIYHIGDVNCCDLSSWVCVLLFEKFPDAYNNFPFTQACCWSENLQHVCIKTWSVDSWPVPTFDQADSCWQANLLTKSYLYIY